MEGGAQMNYTTDPITPADADAIAAYYESGVYNINQLARIYRTSRYRVRQIVKPTPRPVPTQPLYAWDAVEGWTRRS